MTEYSHLLGSSDSDKSEPLTPRKAQHIEKELIVNE